MKLALFGSYGSGKTTYLYNILKRYKNVLILTKNVVDHNPYPNLSLRDLFSKLSTHYVMIEIEEDYVFYLIYSRYFKDRGYKNFQEFLRDARNLVKLLFLKDVPIDAVHSSNKLFFLFKRAYLAYTHKLKNEGFLPYGSVLDYVGHSLKDYLRNYDMIALEDIDSFSMKEIKVILESSKNVIVTYSDESLHPFLKKQGFEFKLLNSVNTKNVRRKKVSNSLLLFYLESLHNTNAAFLLTKTTRRKIENFMRMRKMEVQQNKNINEIYDYLSNLKYGFYKNKEKPQILERLEKINDVLDADMQHIIDFFESYEDVFFYDLKNVFSDPYELLGKRYEILYIEENVLERRPLTLNKLYPYDFLSLKNILPLEKFKEDIHFYVSKAKNIFIIEGEESENVNITIDYVDEKTKKDNIFSFSQITTYLSCPYKYMFKYVYNIPEEPAPFFVFGRVIHELIEEFSKGDIKEEKEVLEEFKKRMHEKQEIFKGHFEYYLKKGKKMLANFFKYDSQLQQQYETKGVEMKINVQLPNNITLVGVIDRLLYDKNKDSYVILDYKTSRQNLGNFDDSKGKDQLMLYSYLIRENEGIDIDKVMLLFLENNTVVSFDVDDLTITNLLSTIDDVVRKIKRRIFTPQPSSTCQYCFYKLLCKYWQGTR